MEDKNTYTELETIGHSTFDMEKIQISEDGQILVKKGPYTDTIFRFENLDMQTKENNESFLNYNVKLNTFVVDGTVTDVEHDNTAYAGFLNTVATPVISQMISDLSESLKNDPELQKEFNDAVAAQNAQKKY